MQLRRGMWSCEEIQVLVESVHSTADFINDLRPYDSYESGYCGARPCYLVEARGSENIDTNFILVGKARKHDTSSWSLTYTLSWSFKQLSMVRNCILAEHAVQATALAASSLSKNQPAAPNAKIEPTAVIQLIFPSWVGYSFCK